MSEEVIYVKKIYSSYYLYKKLLVAKKNDLLHTKLSPSYKQFNQQYKKYIENDPEAKNTAAHS